MKEKFAKLIDVRTIVTFGVVGTLMYLAIVGKLDATKMYELGLMIIAFFFVKKADEKKSGT